MPIMGNLYRMVDVSLKAAKLLPALRAHDPVNGHWAKLSYRRMVHPSRS